MLFRSDGKAPQTKITEAEAENESSASVEARGDAHAVFSSLTKNAPEERDSAKKGRRPTIGHYHEDDAPNMFAKVLWDNGPCVNSLTALCIPSAFLPFLGPPIPRILKIKIGNRCTSYVKARR